jgi:hypothetical protein
MIPSEKYTGSSTILLVEVPFRKVQAFGERREGRKEKKGKESLEKIDGFLKAWKAMNGRRERKGWKRKARKCR